MRNTHIQKDGHLGIYGPGIYIVKMYIYIARVQDVLLDVKLDIK